MKIHFANNHRAYYFGTVLVFSTYLDEQIVVNELPPNRSHICYRAHVSIAHLCAIPEHVLSN